jgi:hypothetical protein
VVGLLNSQIENVSQLFQSCLNVKATLTVAPEKNSMLGGFLSLSLFSPPSPALLYPLPSPFFSIYLLTI